jgi:hypothetical protein
MKAPPTKKPPPTKHYENCAPCAAGHHAACTTPGDCMTHRNAFEHGVAIGKSQANKNLDRALKTHHIDMGLLREMAKRTVDDKHGRTAQHAALCRAVLECL